MRTLLYSLAVAAFCWGSVMAQTTEPQQLRAAQTSLRAEAVEDWTPKEQYTLTTRYEATDIYGKKWNIDQMLKSDKIVLIDFSAVWCFPCWGFHGTGLLDKLQELYGEKGTNQLQVLWVEAEGNPEEAIRGKKVGDYPVMGDWTVGDTWPIPIITDAYFAPILGVKISSVPTIVAVLPGGHFVDVTVPAMGNFPPEGELTDEILTEVAQKVFASFSDLGMKPTDKPQIAYLNAPNSVTDRVEVMDDYFVKTVDEITSYAWTFEGGTPATSTEAQPKVSFATAGEHKATLKVTDKNGESEVASVTINVEPRTFIDKFPFETKFEDLAIDLQWNIRDNDGDGHAWYTAKDYLTNRMEMPFNELNANRMGWYRSGTNALVSFSFLPAEITEDGRARGAYLDGVDDWAIAPGIQIPADAQQPVAFFWVRSIGAASFDHLVVKLSTEGQEPELLTLAGKANAEYKNFWQQVVIDLSAYKGKTVYVGLGHQEPVHKFAICVDDFGASLDGTTAVSAPQAGQVAVTLLPSALRVAGAGLVSAQLYDLNGAPVAQAQAQGSDTIELSTASCPRGSYALVVKTQSGATSVTKVLLP